MIQMSLFDAARTHMIESQLRPNKVADDRVLRAFASIRRELFVPERLRSVAYIDEDIPLGGGRYLMAPMVSARLVQAAALKRADTAMVVGAGTGYEAAITGMLARAVVAVEEDPQLARQAHAAIVEHSIASVNVVEARLAEGHRQRAPYDVILFAGAVADIPPEIASQLSDEGRLVAVVKMADGIGRAMLMRRAGGLLTRRVIFDAAVPLLPGFQPKPAFVF
jgi:protein-L-isoaspartate(D-aspartate) O-methyltransferase